MQHNKRNWQSVSVTPHSVQSPCLTLVGCSAVKGSCGTTIPDMHKRSKCFSPEGHSKARLLQHGSDALRQDAIGTLCNTILLRACSNSVLALDTTLVGEGEHGIAHILPSLVISQCFDPPFSLVLCKCFKLLKSIEKVRFGLNWEHKAVPGIIIDECHPVAISREWGMGNSMDVRVDKFQWSRGAPGGAGEWICMHFAC